MRKKFLKTFLIFSLLIAAIPNEKAMAISNSGLSYPFQRFEYDGSYVYDFGLNFILDKSIGAGRLTNDSLMLGSNNSSADGVTNTYRRDRSTEYQGDCGTAKARGWTHYKNEWLSWSTYERFYSDGYAEWLCGYDTWTANGFSKNQGNYIQYKDDPPYGKRGPWYDGNRENYYRRPVLMLYKRNKPNPVLMKTYMCDEGKPTYSEGNRLWVNGNNDFKIRTWGYDLYPNSYGQEAQYEANIRWLYLGLTANNFHESQYNNKQYCDFVGKIDGNNSDGNYKDFLSPWDLGGDRMEYIAPYWRGYDGDKRETYDGLRRNGMGIEMGAKLNHMEEVYPCSKLENKYEVTTGDWYRYFDYNGTKYNTIKADSEAPTGTDAYIDNLTPFGYDIVVRGVSDNGQSGVNRVIFPTWTEKNGQDDIQSNWYSSATGENLGNGTWKYHVNTSDHNNESGEYNTHIYLIDNVGNQNSFKQFKVTMEKAEVIADKVSINDSYQSNGVNWVKQDSNFGIKISGRTAFNCSQYKINSLHPLIKHNYGSTYINGYIRNYEQTSTNGGVSTDENPYLKFNGVFTRRNQNYAESIFSTKLTRDNERLTIYPLLRVYRDGDYTDDNKIIISNEWLESGKETVVISDGVAPSVNGMPSSAWTNKDVSFTLCANDTGSGVRSIDLYEGNMRIASEKNTISYVEKNEGINNFRVIASDNVGNTKEQTFQIKIDKTAPTVTGILPERWSREDITIELSALDNGSGMKSIELFRNGTKVSSGNEYINYVEKNEGINRFKVVAIDNVGNKTEEEFQVMIDKTAPSIDGIPSNSWTNKDVAFTLTAKDNGSGVKAIELYKENVRLVSGVGSLNYVEKNEGVHNFKVVTIDNVGNAKEQNFQVRIDKTPPTVMGIPPEDWITEDINISLKAIDNLSGMKSITLSRDNNTITTGVDSINYTHREDGSFVYSIVAVDNAGNIYIRNFTVNKASNKIFGLANLYRVDKIGEVNRQRVEGPVGAPLPIYTGTKACMEIDNMGTNLIDVEFYKDSIPIKDISFLGINEELISYDGSITLFEESKLKPGDNPSDNKVSLKISDFTKRNKTQFEFILPKSLPEKSVISMKITCYNKAGNKINNELGSKFFIVKGNPYKDININNTR